MVEMCLLCVSLAVDNAAAVDVASCPRETHFLCHDNSACVPHTWLCDSANDCDDRSDETAAAGCSGRLRAHGCQNASRVLLGCVFGNVISSPVQIVFFFISNRIVELLFEISNRIVIVVSKVTSSKYLLNKFNCFLWHRTAVLSVVGVSVLGGAIMGQYNIDFVGC